MKRKRGSVLFVAALVACGPAALAKNVKEHFREPIERPFKEHISIKSRPERGELDRHLEGAARGKVIEPTDRPEGGTFRVPEIRTRNGTRVKPYEIQEERFHARPWVERTGEDPPAPASPGATIVYDGAGVSGQLPSDMYLPTLPQIGRQPPPLNLPILPQIGRQQP
jgi:hypothetical protein